MQGAYRDDNGKPVVLNVVREAEARISGANFMEYLPIGGLKPFNELSVKLAYGEDADCIKDGRVAAVQSLSGTGEHFAPQQSSEPHSGSLAGSKYEVLLSQRAGFTDVLLLLERAGSNSGCCRRR
jgi:hypothetical protein